MPRYPTPWHPDVAVEPLGTIARAGRNTHRLVLGTHTSTHVDAPYHFLEGGETVEALPLEALVGPARVVNLLPVKSFHEIGKESLAPHFEGDAPPERLLFRADWSDHWGTPKFYGEYPYFTREASRFLVERGVKLLGFDFPSPDDPRGPGPDGIDSPNHKVLLAAGVVLVEYLANLREIRRPDVWLVALPLSIAGADGAPARVIAIDSDAF